MLIFLSCVAGAFLGAITSATATAAIMIPLLVGIANDIGVSRSKLLYPSMACANIATQMTFLGQGASNMAWNDVMMAGWRTDTAAHLGFHHRTHSDADHCHPVHDLCWL